MAGRDAIVGIAAVGLAVLYWWGADAIPTSPLAGTVGAAGLPKALAWALGILAALLVLHGVVLGRVMAATRIASARTSEIPPGAEGWGAHRRALVMLAFGAAYIALVEWLGYVLSVLALFTGVAVYNGARASWRLAAISIGMSILFYLLFVRFLSIPLPAGIWPELLGA